MSATILPFSSTTSEKITSQPGLDEKAHLARVTEAYSRRVDYNIRWVSGIGYEYISKVLLAVFRSIIASRWRYTDIDTYMKAEYQLTNCTIFDCARIVHDIDEYLGKIHVQESPEKAFFMHIRNIAFLRKQELREEKSHD